MVDGKDSEPGAGQPIAATTKEQYAEGRKIKDEPSTNEALLTGVDVDQCLPTSIAVLSPLALPAWLEDDDVKAEGDLGDGGLLMNA